MKRRRRPWRGVLILVLIAVGLPAAVVGGLVRSRAARVEGARADVAARSYQAALDRLEPLEGTRPWFDRTPAGEVDYLIGFARWQLGRRKEALASFGRMPASAPRAVDAAGYVAEGLIEQGRWRAAEEMLARTEARGGDPAALYTVRKALDRLYRMQARFAEAGQMLRRAWPEEPNAVAALKALWRTERGTPPYGTITQALDAAAKLDPRDDRVWLGRARVALGTGRLDECAEWLSKCSIPPGRPDAAVYRTWLDYAAATDQPDQAVRALRALGRSGLTDVEWLAWRAWFAQRNDDPETEAAALNRLLEMEPRNPRWLSRGAALAAESGAESTAVARRKLKAEVDDALDAYTQAMAATSPATTADERLRLGQLATRAGRPFDARAWFTLALQADPKNVAARAAIDQAAPAEPRLAEAQRPNDPDPWDPSVSGDAGQLATAPPPATTSPQFVDVADAAGLRHVFENGETPIRQMPVALSGGVGLVDYDGDGRLDVYCLQGGPFPAADPPSTSDRLFRNRGDGTFQDVSAASGIERLARGYGQGIAVGDVDRDGLPDLFLTRWRRYQLLRNKGDGTFEDITEARGLGGDRDWPTSAALADLDNDGDLDLYVCHYVAWDERDPRLCRNGETNAYMSCNPKSCESRPDHLFRNDGGTFVDVSKEAGIAAADTDGRGLGVVAADLDEDGKVDLFVANDKSANFLFRNLGGFKFAEIAHEAGVAGGAEGGYQAGMGVAAGDVDGDGRPDLVVTNYYGESTTFFRNFGGWVFIDRTQPSGLGALSRTRLGFGVGLIDANNDGRLDVLTANGHTDDLGDTPFRMPMQLLLGLPGGRFQDATSQAGPALERPRLARGMALGDLDNDGRPDAVVVDQSQPLAVLHNQTPRLQHWIGFELVGTTSNPDGVGAVVTVDAARRHLVGRRVGGGSYLSASDPRLHFGLGHSAEVEAVDVLWPSGQVSRYRRLAADRYYRIREGSADAVALPPSPSWPPRR